MSTATASSTGTSSTATSSSSNPLSLDLSYLISLFADFTAFTPAAGSSWNDKDGQAAAFVMAGSEYRIFKPTVTQATRNFSQTDRNNFAQRLNELRAAVDHNPTATPDQKAKFGEDIDAVEAAFASVTSLPSLKIEATIEHIRNNQSDDSCALRVEVVWAETLRCWMPSSMSAGFEWGTNQLAVPDEVIDLFQLPQGGPVLSMLPVPIFPVYGEIAQLGQYIAIGMMAWNFALKKLNNFADDGGRLYFPNVVVQCLVRILNSVTPRAGTVFTNQLAAPDLDGVGKTWRARYDSMSVIGRPDFRTNTYDIVEQIPTASTGQTITGTYRVSLPDIAFLAGGACTLITFKIEVKESNGCAAITMLFDNYGALQMIVGHTQLGNKLVLRQSTRPTWRQSPNDTVDGIVNSFIALDFGDHAMNADAPTGSTDHDDIRDNNMGNIMSQVAKSFGNHMRRISSSLLKTGLPQLPSLTSLSDARYDYGSRPSVAVVSSDKAVEIHQNPGSQLFRNVLRLGSSVSTQSYDGYYQDGEDPTIAVLANGTTVLDVHGGNTDNNLFYSVGTLSGSGLSMPGKGTDYDDGEDPCLAVANRDGEDRIFEVHRSESAGSKNLYFNTATYAGGSLKWSANGTLYDTGSAPFAAFAPDQDTLVVAHEDGDDVKVRVGNSKSSSVDWFGSAKTVMSGSEPTIAVTTNNRVVLIAQNSSGDLIHSIGLLNSDGSIRWAVSGVRQKNGLWPCLARMSDGKLLLAYEHSSNQGQLFGSILTVSVPAGYYD